VTLLRFRSLRCGSLWPDHGRVPVKKCLQFGQVQGSQPITVLSCDQRLRKYTIFSNFTTIQDIDNAVVDQIVCHQRRGTSARTLSTNAGQPSPHFEAQSFPPYPVTGGPISPRAGLIGRYNLALGALADKGDPIRCLRLAVRMKAQGVKPDTLTYNCLIRACGREALGWWAVAFFEDMLAAGLQPERETFHLLFKVSVPVHIDPRLFADLGKGPF